MKPSSLEGLKLEERDLFISQGSSHMKRLYTLHHDNRGYTIRQQEAFLAKEKEKFRKNAQTCAVAVFTVSVALLIVFVAYITFEALFLHFCK